jgi:hypothetical protein
MLGEGDHILASTVRWRKESSDVCMDELERFVLAGFLLGRDEFVRATVLLSEQTCFACASIRASVTDFNLAKVSYGFGTGTGLAWSVDVGRSWLEIGCFNSSQYVDALRQLSSGYP